MAESPKGRLLQPARIAGPSCVVPAIMTHNWIET